MKTVEEIAETAAYASGDPAIHGVVVLVLRGPPGEHAIELACAGTVCCRGRILGVHDIVNRALSAAAGVPLQPVQIVEGRVSGQTVVSEDDDPKEGGPETVH